MMQRKQKILLALSAFCLGVATFGVLWGESKTDGVQVNAEQAPAAVRQVDNGFKIASGYTSAKYATFPAINVYRNAKSVTASEGNLDLRIPVLVSDLTDVVSLYVRYGNPTDKTVESVFSLVDENNVVCAWKYNPSTLVGYTPDKYTGTDDVTQATADGEGVQNWYYTKILAGDDCWYTYDLADSQTYPNATAYNTSGTFDKTKTKYALVRVATNYAECQVNVGEIYAKKADGSFIKLFDPTTVTGVGTQATEGVYVSAKDGTATSGTYADIVNDYEVSMHRADEIKLGDNVTAEWYGFSLPNTPTDLSAYNGIRYTVDLTNCGNIYMNKFLTDTSNAGGVNELWYSNWEFAMYYPEGTDTHYSGSVNTIPAGFKGDIVVPFVNLVPNANYTKDRVLDLQNLTGELGFTVQTSVGKGNFILKDVRFVKDALVSYTVLPYFEDINGNFVQATYENGRRFKTEAIAGSDALVPTEITSPLGTYVYDANNVNNGVSYDKNYGAAELLIQEGATFDGGATWGCLPTAYYTLKAPYEIEKVFGLDGLPTSVSATTTKEEILKSFPNGSITVGLNDKSTYALNGSWNAVKEGDTMQVTFTPTAMPKNLTDPNGMLSVEIALVREVKLMYVTEPTRTEYAVGEELDLTGLKVSLLYMDGGTRTLTAEEYEVSGFDGTTAGDQTITVTYKNGDKTFTKTFTVSVTEPTSSTQPKKKGCGSMIVGVSGTVVAMGIALVAVGKKRRKKDE